MKWEGDVCHKIDFSPWVLEQDGGYCLEKKAIGMPFCALCFQWHGHGGIGASAPHFCRDGLKISLNLTRKQVWVGRSSKSLEE